MSHDEEEDVDGTVVGTVYPSSFSARARRQPASATTFNTYRPGAIDTSKSDGSDEELALKAHQAHLAAAKRDLLTALEQAAERNRAQGWTGGKIAQLGTSIPSTSFFGKLFKLRQRIFEEHKIWTVLIGVYAVDASGRLLRRLEHHPEYHNAVEEIDIDMLVYRSNQTLEDIAYFIECIDNLFR
jgi:hypothetical protein